MHVIVPVHHGLCRWLSIHVARGDATHLEHRQQRFPCLDQFRLLFVGHSDPDVVVEYVEARPAGQVEVVDGLHLVGFGEQAHVRPHPTGFSYTERATPFLPLPLVCLCEVATCSEPVQNMWVNG